MIGSSSAASRQADAAFRYFVFISYSRKDERAARWLQKRLEWFRLPVKLVEESCRPPHPRYLRPVYRDKTDLEVDAHHYWLNIERAITGSRFMIVLCSRHSAQSEAVNREVLHFLSQENGPERILPVIFDGSITSEGEDACLCPALRALGESILSRNLPSLVPAEDENERDGWERGFVGIVAFLLRIERKAVGDHIQKEERRRAVMARALSAVFAALAISATGLGLLAWKKQREATEQKEIAVRTLAGARHQQAVEQLDKGDSFEAMSYALDAHRLQPRDPVSTALLFSLLTHHVPTVPIYPPVPLAGDPAIISVHPDNAMLTTSGLGLPLQIWNLEDGSMLAEAPAGTGELSFGGFTVDGEGVYLNSERTLGLRMWRGLPEGEASIRFDCALPLRFLPFGPDGGPVLGSVIPEAIENSKWMGVNSQVDAWPIMAGDLKHWQQFGSTGDEAGLQRWETHEEEPVTELRMSRDGKRAVSADGGGLLVTWDLEKGVQLATIQAGSEINGLEFSPDGRHLLVAIRRSSNQDGGAIDRYEVDTGRRISHWHFGTDCLATAFSGDGHLYAGSSADSWVQMWDSGSAARVFLHRGQNDTTHLTISKNGEMLFCGTKWSGFRLLDAPSRRPESSHVPGRFEVEEAGWHEGAGLVWTLDESHTLRTYRDDFSSLSCILLPHLGEGEQVVFSEDGGRLLVTTSEPGTHQVWDVATALPLHRAVRHGSDVVGGGFLGDDRGVHVASQDNESGTWDFSGGAGDNLAKLPFLHRLTGARLSRNQRLLMTTRLDFSSLVSLLAAEAGDGSPQEIFSLMRDGGMEKLRAGITSTLTSHRLADSSPPKSITLPGMIFVAASDDHGRICLAIGTSEIAGAIEALILRDGVLAGRIPLSGVTKPVAAISPDGRFGFVTDNSRGGLLLALEPSPATIARVSHLHEINDAQFSPDNRLLATVSDDGTARLWNTADGAPTSQALRSRSDGALYTLDFSPDGRWLATGGSDESAVIWEASSGRRASIDLTADDTIRDVEFSPDGRWLATCGDDGIARLWEWLGQGDLTPPTMIRDIVTLVSEKPTSDAGNRAKENAPTPASLLSRADALPPGPWRNAFRSLFVPASERSVTPSSTLTGAQDRLRQARIRLRMGDHVGAVHDVRLALRARPELDVPPELESLRNLIAGRPVDASSIDQRSGQHVSGAGTTPGERRAVEGSPVLRWCPPGRFRMGSAPGSFRRWNNETHREVFLTRGYWMAETETTQRQWREVMSQSLVDAARLALADEDKHAYNGKGTEAIALRSRLGIGGEVSPENVVGIQEDDFPVYWVSMDQANEFCRRLTQRERSTGGIDGSWAYRLPTEAEWEYACRAGTTGTLYDGDLRDASTDYNAPELDALAWYGGNSCHDYPSDLPGWNCETWKGRAYPGNKAGPRRVGLKKPNPWGLRDMLGNVHEWTSSVDDYRLTTQRVNPEFSDLDQSESGKAVFRGGCWNNFAVGCRSSSRTTEHPAFRSNYLGFRIVLAPVPEEAEN